MAAAAQREEYKAFKKLLASAESAMEDVEFNTLTLTPDQLPEYQGHEFYRFEVPRKSEIAKLFGKLRRRLPPEVWRGFGDGTYPTLYIWSYKARVTLPPGDKYRIARLKPVLMNSLNYNFGIRIYVENIG